MQPRITGNFAALPTRVVRAANDQRLFRACVEREIERLIDLLDAIDGDPDLEDVADNEPWLGWAHCQVNSPHYHPEDDREEENEHGSEGGMQ